ncbi:MAG: hypothetical protein Kow0032_11600 [Methyloligellaceae bacterium]
MSLGPAPGVTGASSTAATGSGARRRPISPLDFGDPGISKEQAIIHYDPKDRKFLFIPQLDVENFSYVNQEKPTAPVELKALDEIEMAATTLRFVPLCGPKFDWSDLGKT